MDKILDEEKFIFEKITYEELTLRLSKEEVIKYIIDVPPDNKVLSYLISSLLKSMDVCKKYKQNEFVTPQKFLLVFNNARTSTSARFGKKESEEAETIIKFSLLENMIGPAFASEVRRLAW